MKIKKISQGFTFIEILVVVTIIAVLTMVGVTNFKVANQKARDGRRQGDLQQIRAALELYRTDQNVYPTTAEFVSPLEADGTTYIELIPTDPLEANSYVYDSADGSTYTLGAYLELADTDVSSLTGCSDAASDCNYQVTSPL
jgi:general secretion pathway protein G